VWDPRRDEDRCWRGIRFESAAELREITETPIRFRLSAGCARGEWVHIGFVVSPGSLVLYLNGEMVDEIDTPERIRYQEGDLSVGHVQYGSFG